MTRWVAGRMGALAAWIYPHAGWAAPPARRLPAASPPTPALQPTPLARQRPGRDSDGRQPPWAPPVFTCGAAEGWPLGGTHLRPPQSSTVLHSALQLLAPVAPHAPIGYNAGDVGRSALVLSIALLRIDQCISSPANGSTSLRPNIPRPGLGWCIGIVPSSQQRFGRLRSYGHAFQVRIKSAS
jgi:hypothetical protein